MPIYEYQIYKFHSNYPKDSSETLEATFYVGPFAMEYVRQKRDKHLYTIVVYEFTDNGKLLASKVAGTSII